MGKDRGAPAPPPADLHARPLVLRRLKSGPWWRIHRADVGPCYFSTDPGNRFSSPGLGVLYLADAPLTAFWEIFWDELATRPLGERRIASARLDARHIAPARLRRKVAVFDATSPRQLRNVGAPAATFSGDYANCQAWALALATHPQQPQGILYPSARTFGRRCLALFGGAFHGAGVVFERGCPLGKDAEIVAGLVDDHVDVLDEDLR